MSYRIEGIEGIGPTYAKQLATAGIRTTRDLLRSCASRKGRKEAAEKTGVSEKHLLKWANLADLMRISGIATQFSELLEAAGVDTVKELRNRNAANLAAKMQEVNAEKKLTRRTPALAVVEGWVELAKTLDPVITH
jgi:predicted flap endonuclease-1-like 5' DNA nuclease